MIGTVASCNLEIPDKAKTGSGPPLLLASSFPYVHDWLNEYPFKNEPSAALICNVFTGAPFMINYYNLGTLSYSQDSLYFHNFFYWYNGILSSFLKV